MATCEAAERIQVGLSRVREEHTQNIGQPHQLSFVFARVPVCVCVCVCLT